METFASKINQVSTTIATRNLSCGDELMETAKPTASYRKVKRLAISLVEMN